MVKIEGLCVGGLLWGRDFGEWEWFIGKGKSLWTIGVFFFWGFVEACVEYTWELFV